MSLLQKKSNPAAIAPSIAAGGHGEMPGDDPALEGLESNTKYGMMGRPDYGTGYTAVLNDANGEPDEFNKEGAEPAPSGDLFPHKKDLRYLIEQVIGSGLFSAGDETYFDKMGCDYCKSGAGEVSDAFGWTSTKEIEEDRDGNRLEFKLCGDCLNKLYYEGAPDRGITVASKTAERTILPRQTTPQSGYYAHDPYMSGRAMPIAEDPHAQPPAQQRTTMPTRVRQTAPIGEPAAPKPAPAWVTGSEEGKGVEAGFHVAIEAAGIENYVSAVEFAPKNAMRVEKFSFTADRDRAVSFHRLTAEDVAKQLSGPGFKVAARAVNAAVNYAEMFQAVEQAVGSAQPKPNIEPLIRREIEWAKSALKKQDRIVWYLRLYRMALVAQLIKTIPAKVKQPVRAGKVADELPQAPAAPGQAPPAVVQPKIDGAPKPKRPKVPTLKSKLRAMLEKYKGEFAAKGGQTAHLPAVEDFPNIKRQLEHWYSLPIPAIQNTVFSVQSWGDIQNAFSAAEEEWQEKAKALIKPHAEDRVWMQFPDGWAWWWLPRASCDDESKAMGHCGNSPMAGRKGISILSLREPVQHGKETLWYPHATFILHGEGDSGSLGEMKGRANKKPVAKYHPYIMAMLKDPRIHSVVGGGYLPEENFDMGDLTPEQRKEITQANPNIGLTIKDYYETNGMDEKLAGRIKSVLELGDTARFREGVGFVLREWPDMAEFVKACGSTKAKEAYEFTQTGKYDQSDPDGDEMADLLDEVDDSQLRHAGQAIQYHYKPEIDQWYEGAFDPSNLEQVKRAIVDIYEVKIAPKKKKPSDEESRRYEKLGIKPQQAQPGEDVYDIPVIKEFRMAYADGGPDEDGTWELIREGIEKGFEAAKSKLVREGDKFAQVIDPAVAAQAATEAEQGTRRYTYGRTRQFDEPDFDVPYNWDEWSEERAVDALRYFLDRPPARPEMERQRELPYEGEGMRVSKLLKNPLFSKAYAKATR